MYGVCLVSVYVVPLLKGIVFFLKSSCASLFDLSHIYIVCSMNMLSLF